MCSVSARGEADDVPLGVEGGRHLRHTAQDGLVAEACGQDVDVPAPAEEGDDEGVRTARGRHVVDGLLEPGGLDRRQDGVIRGGQLLSGRRHSRRHHTLARGKHGTAMFLQTPIAAERCRNVRLARHSQ